MKVQSDPSDLVITIRDALSSECVDELERRAESHSDWVPLNEYQDSKSPDHDFGKFVPVLISRRLAIDNGLGHLTRQTLGEIAAKVFSLDITEYSGVGFSKYVSGSLLSTHQDTDFGLNPRIVTFVLYLSEKYDGGEVSFPSIKLTCRPKRGEILIFPSLLEHSVGRVICGQRIVATWFGLCRAALIAQNGHRNT